MSSSSVLEQLQALAVEMKRRGTAKSQEDTAALSRRTALQEQFINKVNAVVAERQGGCGGKQPQPLTTGRKKPQATQPTSRHTDPAPRNHRSSSDMPSVADDEHNRSHPRVSHDRDRHSKRSSRNTSSERAAPSSGKHANEPFNRSIGGRSGAVAPSTVDNGSISIPPSDIHSEVSAVHMEGDMSIELSDGVGTDPFATNDVTETDGVRTLVIWPSAHARLFAECNDAVWQPELVEIREGGMSRQPTTEAEMLENSEDDDEQHHAWVLPAFHDGGAIDFPTLTATLQRARAGKMRRQDTVPLNTSQIDDKVPDDVPLIEVDYEVRFNRGNACKERRPKVKELLGGPEHSAITAIQLNVVYEPYKTGFEDEKDFPLKIGTIVADRYRINQMLGQGTFCRVVQCDDLDRPLVDEGEENPEDADQFEQVCLKFVNNSKDFFDQSLDEIKLLHLLNSRGDADEVHVVELHDYFYYKEHMVIVTELLSDNLYEYQKYDREHQDGNYFTLDRLRSIAKQMTEALAFVHSLQLIHCDLKPENVLFRSHSRCEVKVIDFGSSCFTSDTLGTYIQSRSYRAPEVILGCDYDGRIDVWSLGAIMVEMVTADVLFSSETCAEMLSRISAHCGMRFPRRMLIEGSSSHHFFNQHGHIFERGSATEASGEECHYLYEPADAAPATGVPQHDTHQAIVNQLAAHGITDAEFIDFLKECLQIDPNERPTSAELLKHPFLQ